jgi:putative inorganic carbon (hco3(-)) transporter
MRNKSVSSNTVQAFIQRMFLAEKLNNWLGAIVALLIAVAFGYALSVDLIKGLGIFAAIVGLFVFLLCILSPQAGLYIITLYAFSASALSRFIFKDQLPVGVVNDILVFTTFLGLFFSNDGLNKNTRLFFKNRPVFYYSIILLYLTLELANPLAHSFEGWLQVMRKVFESFVIVFIAYNVFDKLSRIRRFIKFLFFLALIVGAYGCFQQWHGLLGPELDWVHANPLRFGLINIWGEYRKFSLLGGPTEFGIIMAACSLLFLLLGLNEENSFNKVLYTTGSVFMMLGMSYSGTRTANAMVVGGLILFLLLTIDKKSSKLFACFAVLTFLFIMYVPIYSSATLLRFRSTFTAKQDASYNVRERNRQGVQPFIWSHPFGGGLSTTGEMGEKYNPGHPIAGFPTDSSYLNKALESGWVGMAMTLVLYYSTLLYIIRSYFITKNKEFKTFFSASVAFFFSYFIGEITQEAVGVFTNMVVYFPVFAIVLKLRQFSEEEQMKALEATS